MKNLLKNKFGLTLVETMVAMGMMSMVTLGTVNLIQTNSQAKKSFEQTAQVATWSGQANILLGDPDACRVTFTGMLYSAGDPTALKFANGSDSGVAEGAKVQNAVITSIAFQDKSDLGVDANGMPTSVITIRIIFTITNGARVKTIERDFQFHAHLEADNDTITSCYGEFSEITFKTLACQHLGATINGAPEICDLYPSDGVQRLDETLETFHTSMGSLSTYLEALGSSLTSTQQDVTDLKTSVSKLQKAICALLGGGVGGFDWESKLSPVAVATLTEGCERLCTSPANLNKFDCTMDAGGTVYDVGTCSICQITAAVGDASCPSPFQEYNDWASYEAITLGDEVIPVNDCGLTCGGECDIPARSFQDTAATVCEYYVAATDVDLVQYSWQSYGVAIPPATSGLLATEGPTLLDPPAENATAPAGCGTVPDTCDGAGVVAGTTACFWSATSCHRSTCIRTCPAFQEVTGRRGSIGCH